MIKINIIFPEVFTSLALLEIEVDSNSAIRNVI